MNARWLVAALPLVAGGCIPEPDFLAGFTPLPGLILSFGDAVVNCPERLPHASWLWPVPILDVHSHGLQVRAPCEPDYTKPGFPCRPNVTNLDTPPQAKLDVWFAGIYLDHGWTDYRITEQVNDSGIKHGWENWRWGANTQLDTGEVFYVYQPWLNDWRYPREAPGYFWLADPRTGCSIYLEVAIGCASEYQDTPDCLLPSQYQPEVY